MSEAKRYGHIGYLANATDKLIELYPDMTVYVKAADFDRVTAERDEAMGQLKEKREEFNKLGDRYDALQQRLTAADVRADVLEGFLRTSLIAMKRIYQAGYDRIIAAGGTCDTPEYMMESDPTARDILDALKPAVVQRNQCDGCQAGIPVVNGAHRMGKPGGYPDTMSCTARLYKP